jgi:hypothetical protein
MKKLMLATLVALAAVSSADAQIRGMGRIQGTVVDEGGAPLAGVVITAKLPGRAGDIGSKTDDKGVWYVGGMARGEWLVDFEKPGYGERHAKINLEVEIARVPPIAVTMKKGA